MMSQNNQMTAQQKVSTVRGMLQQAEGELRNALPKHMDATRMARIAMTTFQRTPQLLECDPKTLIGKIMECAQLGLEPDGILGGAYLLPFRNNRENKMDVQLIVGYKGLIDLARRSGLVSDISAHIVYDQEHFKYEAGLVPTLEHKPLPPSKRGKEIVGAYAVALMKDGTTSNAFMWLEELLEVQKGSKAGNNGPWKSHWAEMAKKTVIRRLAKTLPLSPEFSKAATFDEYQEAGIDLGGSVNIVEEPVKSLADAVTEAPATEESGGE